MSPLLVPLVHRAPQHWRSSCTHTECTLHQVSPYIGKLKSRIAADLITAYTKPGDLVADVFCGSGTIPLEAMRLGRRVFASDTNPYAMVLTRGKLLAPDDIETAYRRADRLLAVAAHTQDPNISATPDWVQRFFHPNTLKEILSFSKTAREHDDNFLLSCLLGILHHQRPGFLSYPSSHLVPYLRNKKYPRCHYPDLYAYRPLRPRLLAKISRTLRRPLPTNRRHCDACLEFKQVQDVQLPDNLDCLITSPPYMNALDYGRDNRLRLWFLGGQDPDDLDRLTGGYSAFCGAIEDLARKLAAKLRPLGRAIFVIGDQKKRRRSVAYPSDALMRIMERLAPSLRLETVLRDEIPDIRRARRHVRGVKSEHILIYRKSNAQISS